MRTSSILFKDLLTVPHLALIISVNSLSVRHGCVLSCLNLFSTNSLIADKTVPGRAFDSSLALCAVLIPLHPFPKLHFPLASTAFGNMHSSRAIVIFLGVSPIIRAADTFPGARYTSYPLAKRVFLCPDAYNL